MKKLIALLTAMIMLTSFTSCKDTDSKRSIVRVWTNDGGGKSIWRELVDDFNRTTGKKNNIKIEWTTFSTDYESVVDKAFAEGDIPDIVALSGSQVSSFAKSRDILPIADFAGGEEFLEEYRAITPNREKIVDGEVYSVVSTSNVAGLIYNKDLFRKAGIVDENGEPTPPETFDEMREYAKRITDKSKKIYGYSYPMTFTYSLMRPVSASARIKYDFEAGTADMSEYRPVLQTLLDMNEDGSLFPGCETLDSDTARMYFAEGKVGMMAGVSWDVGVLTTQFVANCDWGVAPFPSVDGVQKYPAWHDNSGTYFITKNAKKIDDEKIMAVYRFMFSRETRMAMYENNIRISCMTDIKENADESNLLPQFKQFAEIFDESYDAYTANRIMQGNPPKDWIKVWKGEMTLDEMITTWNAQESASFAEKIKAGKLNPDDYK